MNSKLYLDRIKRDKKKYCMPSKPDELTCYADYYLNNMGYFPQPWDGKWTIINDDIFFNPNLNPNFKLIKNKCLCPNAKCLQCTLHKCKKDMKCLCPNACLGWKTQKKVCVLNDCILLKDKCLCPNYCPGLKK